MTNDTFASELCAAISDTLTATVSIASIGEGFTYYYSVPACFKSKGLAVTVVSLGGYLALGDFSVLPSSLQSLTVARIHFGPDLSTSSPDDGFDDEGNIAWAEIWSLFPSITSVTFEGGNFRGPLPLWLPVSLATFSMSPSGLTGTIPASIFRNVTSNSVFTFSVSGSALTGSIPEGLFVTWNGQAKTSIDVDFSYCGLEGPIPLNFLNYFAHMGATSFSLALNNNNLNGTIPGALLYPQMMAGNSNFYLSLASNRLTGPIPSSMISFFEIYSLTLNVSDNLLTGPLPDRLFSSSTWTKRTTGSTSESISLIFRNNNISGTIPPTFLTGGLTASAYSGIFILRLGNNMLNGTIPYNLFYTINGNNSAVAFTSTTQFVVAFAANQLSGTIPSTLLDYSFLLNTPPTSVLLSLDLNEGINGTIPNDLFASVSDNRATTIIFFTASNTSLSGSLPAGFCRTVSQLTIRVANTLVNGSIPEEWTKGCRFDAIFLYGCQNLITTLPANLFTNSSISSFSAANTPVYGALPPISSTLKSFDLNATNIEFCSTASISAFNNVSPWDGTCSLSYSPACNCLESYSKCSPLCASVPSVPALPAPSGCNLNAKPGPEFTCVGGVWTAPTTNATTLTIPSGAGTVVITGNLPSESVVIQGLGNSIQVEGCAGNLTTITIEVDPSQLSTSTKTLQTLLTTGNASCSTDLNSVNLVTTAKSGCKKVKTQKVVSESGSTLSALFTLDRSGCNTWWIILVSVICGVILIAIIVVVLLAVFYKPFRAKIRPFSQRSQNRAAGNP